MGEAGKANSFFAFMTRNNARTVSRPHHTYRIPSYQSFAVVFVVLSCLLFECQLPKVFAAFELRRLLLPHISIAVSDSRGHRRA